MKIIADESLNYKFVFALRNKGYNIFSIAEKHPSIRDEDILEISISPPAIILTEDKGFGELIFKEKKDFITVILLRYDAAETEYVLENLILLLNEYIEELYKCFVTIAYNRTRIRYI